MSIDEASIQDLYVSDYSHCYGCGRLNADGLQIKTRQSGNEFVTRFTPQSRHTAFPGYVYGGLLASLFDCHAMASAAAATAYEQGRAIDGDPPIRFVTASLTVDYLRPTPMGVELEIRGRVLETKGRRVAIEASLRVAGVVTATAQVVAVEMPERLLAPL